MRTFFMEPTLNTSETFLTAKAHGRCLSSHIDVDGKLVAGSIIFKGKSLLQTINANEF